MKLKMVNQNEVWRIWVYCNGTWQPYGRPYNTKGMAIGVAKRGYTARNYKHLKVVCYVAEEEYDII